MDPTRSVSVVIPAHNAESTIDAAIESVLRQTEPALEIIVVDDASTDETATRVSSLARRHGSIRLVSAGTNGGVSRARNIGIAEAAGSWVALLDADDLWSASKLQVQLDHADAHPELSMVGAWFRELFGSRTGALRTELWWPSALLVRREVFDVMSFDPAWRVSELPEFFSRFDERFRRGGVPQELLQYRMNSTGLAHRAFITERKAWMLISENSRRREVDETPISFIDLERWFCEEHPPVRRALLHTAWRGDRLLRRALIEASHRRFSRALLYGASGLLLNPRSALANRHRLPSVGAPRRSR